MRYQQLIPIIAHNKPATIIEIGTWNGLRCLEMVKEALKHSETVFYTGFDLFEDATDETNKRELNVKNHFSEADVRVRLLEFKENNPGFDFNLIKGDTNKTLSEGTEADFAFIDGGHSVETIRHDYECLKGSKVIVLDDFYQDGPDIEKFGCNFLIEEFDRPVVLPQADPIRGGGTTQIVICPSTAWPGKVNMVVKTKNCVPQIEIQDNIRYAMGIIPRWIVNCRLHSEPALLVSGGPSYKDFMPEIKEKAEAGAYVIAVKNTHDFLLENGIIPWACMLLDPRDHVADFIETPHADVKYMVASMVHPTTLDQLVKHNANIIGYHAHVGAGEDDVLKEFANDGENHMLVGGGSTTALRGISVLWALGFRRFDLYGYDSCYDGKPDKVHGRKQNKEPFEVEVLGRKFWTDAELLAQCQDFEIVLQQEQGLEIETYGDGIIQHMWHIVGEAKPAFKDFILG